ncbi:hypothetical protein, partial [Moorena sp. SIO2C4]|uniref:hypothetical protein n=1 Tax=Moorena sp. SIO2C4 TaxID=2607824 RepID=UPI002580CE6C
RQSLMGETTAVAHGGNPQDRAASPRPRCIAFFPVSRSNTPLASALDLANTVSWQDPPSSYG